VAVDSGGSGIPPSAPYLAAVIRDYFPDRRLEYVDRDGAIREREIGCGVPREGDRGSVLGPLL